MYVNLTFRKFALILCDVNFICVVNVASFMSYNKANVFAATKWFPGSSPERGRVRKDSGNEVVAAKKFCP